MPGYDRTGPLGEGSRTGRGLGPCGRPSDAATPAEDAIRGGGAMRRGFGPRGRGLGLGGRGRGRGFGRGGKAMGGFAGLAAAPRPQETALMRQMETLMAALDRVKELLAKRASAERADRE